jgi:Na+/citrate or Na+/malate symporter
MNTFARNLAVYFVLSFLITWIGARSPIKALFFATIFSLLMASVGEWLVNVKLRK